MVLDYSILRLAAWALLSLFAIGVSLTVAAELGAASLWPALNANESQRRVLTEQSAAVTAGNLAWLAALVALLFFGWPSVYAAVFSSFQALLPFLLIPLALRPFALYVRSSLPTDWLEKWDRGLFLGALLPTFLLGVMIGNLIKGLPFHLQSDMRIALLGNLGGLFNPFSMLVGAVATTAATSLGALQLQLSGDTEISARAKALALPLGLSFLSLFALTGLWITHLEGYHVTTDIAPLGPSNPLSKFVRRGDGLWLDNYEHEPALIAIPALVFIAGIAMLICSSRDKAYWGSLAAAVAMAMLVLTAGVSLFPFLAPSNMSLNSSLTVWDASASETALHALLIFGGILFPLMAISSRWR
ncbi:cytochrome d ubiquinol oxidase subunit II [Methylomonas sp. LWB]|uniref:cytochrome d ubiquinol oxidase subunit II n=1 Tax=Methylomonas sp. LWB TaxID=1905845 RepID=UPI0008D9F9D2|nr:cytochrome d ubiquinol oxidase subunit II [Methylomonas sp. LWB]OHX36786.1 cytochrome d ubiquinol oxidase subunit II [Methylomonas sp. LWB]